MLKVALAQIDTVLGDKQKNLSHIEEYCRKAALKQADVICFPELATTGYSPDLLGTELWPLSESRGDKTDRLLSQLSTELDLTIICGFVERGTSLGEIYNSAGVWVPGAESWQGTFQKIHLVGNEKKWFTPGMRCSVFNTPAGGFGVMICHDVGFPEIARILTLKGQGSAILFLLAAWHRERKNIWMINCASRALENGIYLVAVNRWGKEEALNFFGGSQLIAPDGQSLVIASESSEDLVFFDVNFDLQARARLEIPYLRDRRTDIYSIEYLPKR